MSIECQITGCASEAVAHCRFNHPEPTARWESNLCEEHMHQAHADSIGGSGSLTLNKPREEVSETA